jgi:spore coat protein CotH
VKETIRFLAIDNALLDSDGYYSRGSDYYIYLDPEGVFHLVHYDNNETFGGGRGGGPGGPGGPPPNFGPDGPPPGFERGGGRERGARGGQDARRGERRGRGRGPGRGGPGRGGQGGGMTQAPLAFADDPGTRPVIARILAVPAWRAEYLETLREIAEVQLAWNTLGPRVDAYRELIEADVVRDPFLGDRTAFLRSLYGDDQSLKSLASERRRFLLGHADLKPAAPEPK